MFFIKGRGKKGNCKIFYKIIQLIKKLSKFYFLRKNITKKIMKMRL